MTNFIRSMLLLSLLLPGSIAASANEATAISDALPVEVSEVISGGTWSNAGATGYYRAMVVTPRPAGQAYVIVQMLAVEKQDAPPKVAKTISIKEVAEQAFSNAFLAMDADVEDEMTLIITAYGTGRDQDSSIHLKFDAKGDYELLPALSEEAPAERDPAVQN